MKAKQLIKKLEKLVEKNGNVEVIIDHDSEDEGYYSLEDVQTITHKDGEIAINLVSSNEV